MIFYGGTVFGRISFLWTGKFILFGPFFTKIQRFWDLGVKYPLLVSLHEMWIINLINHEKNAIYGNKGYFQDIVKNP